MAWDDNKGIGSELSSSEWNTHVADQKTRITAAGTATLTNKTINEDGTGNAITNLANASIKAAAAIALNKLAATTVSRALVSDGSGFVAVATTTAAEIEYVNGVTSAIQTQLNAKAADTFTINTQTGTSYTLVAGDKSEPVTMNNAGASTLTVPPNSSVAFVTGTSILISQLGAGQVTITAGAGVTIRTPQTLLMRAQYTSCSLLKLGTDEWILSGDLEAA